MIDSVWLKEYFYPSKLKDISPVPHLQSGEHLIYLCKLLKRKKLKSLHNCVSLEDKHNRFWWTGGIVLFENVPF